MPRLQSLKNMFQRSHRTARENSPSRTTRGNPPPGPEQPTRQTAGRTLQEPLPSGPQGSHSAVILRPAPIRNVDSPPPLSPTLVLSADAWRSYHEKYIPAEREYRTQEAVLEKLETFHSAMNETMCSMPKGGCNEWRTAKEKLHLGRSRRIDPQENTWDRDLSEALEALRTGKKSPTQVWNEVSHWPSGGLEQAIEEGIQRRTQVNEIRHWDLLSCITNIEAAYGKLVQWKGSNPFPAAGTSGPQRVRQLIKETPAHGTAGSASPRPGDGTEPSEMDVKRLLNDLQQELIRFKDVRTSSYEPPEENRTAILSKNRQTATINRNRIANLNTTMQRNPGLDANDWFRTTLARVENLQAEADRTMHLIDNGIDRGFDGMVNIIHRTGTLLDELEATARRPS